MFLACLVLIAFMLLPGLHTGLEEKGLLDDILLWTNKAVSYSFIMFFLFIAHTCSTRVGPSGST